MNKYSARNRGIAEIPFNIRLKYFMEIRNLDAKAIGEISEDDNFNGNLERSIYNYLKGITVPKSNSIDRLARILNVHPEHLLCDYGIYWRSIAVVRCKLDGIAYNGEPFNSKGEFCLYGRYEFDTSEYIDKEKFNFNNGGCYDSDYFNISSVEKDEYDIIDEEIDDYVEKITDFIAEKDLFDLYKLTTYNDCYFSFSDHAWDLLIDFNGLDTNEKEELLSFLIDITSIKDFDKASVCISDFMKSIELMLGHDETYFKNDFENIMSKFNDSQDYRTYCLNIVYDLIEQSTPIEIERIAERINDCTTMDLKDWKFLKCHYSLLDLNNDIYYYLEKVITNKIEKLMSKQQNID